MNRIVYDKKAIENNIKEYLALFKKYKNIFYNFPIKACSQKCILDIFYKYKFGFDASNLAEYNLIKDYKTNISLAGPLISELDNEHGNMILYYNSLEDYLNSKRSKDEKGLRINFNYKSSFIFSHFGESLADIPLENLKDIYYLHFHISDKKSIQKLKAIINELKKVLPKCINLKMLDVGGGLDSLPKEKFKWYIESIYSILKPNQKLLIECGDLWFKNAGKLYTRIIDIKEIKKNTFIIFLPISKDCNLKWSYPKYNFNCVDVRNRYAVTFYGSTCYEKDEILKTNIDHKLNIGDQIIFDNISPYSAEWNTSFNGINKIEVIYE